MKINIMGQLARLARLEEQSEREYWHGVQRRATKRANDGDLSKIPVVGQRDVGTPTVAQWDLRGASCRATPMVYPEGITFRIR
jgi:hypothetical protein